MCPSPGQQVLASTAYWLDAGNVPGGNQYYQSGNLGNVLNTTATGLPLNGSTVYVTLYSLVGGQWLSNAYTYTAYSAERGDGADHDSDSWLDVDRQYGDLHLDGGHRRHRRIGWMPEAFPAATSTTSLETWATCSPPR